MSIQWYPGHMTAAKKKIEDALKINDLVIEILDARIP
jgi:ribosome biogenesis GTPase A